MDLRKIKKLIELLEQSELHEIEITEGESTIRLCRNRAPANGVAPAPMPVENIALGGASPPAAPAPAPSPSPEKVAGDAIESPMVGTFYASPSPDEAPFVALGDEVKVGDILCIIEAMKTFNQIRAERAGKITAIHKQSGEPVEYGEALFSLA